MVEFEEIKDEHYEVNEGVDDDDGSDGEFSDASSDDDQDELDRGIQDETVLDRIAALKDIIPAHRRDTIARTFSTASSYGKMAAFIGGKAAYILITTVLMLGIPYALSSEEDKLISEQERQMQLQQGMSEVFPSQRYFLMYRCSHLQLQAHSLPLLRQSHNKNLRSDLQASKFWHSLDSICVCVCCLE